MCTCYISWSAVSFVVDLLTVIVRFSLWLYLSIQFLRLQYWELKKKKVGLVYASLVYATSSEGYAGGKFSNVHLFLCSAALCFFFSFKLHLTQESALIFRRSDEF